MKKSPNSLLGMSKALKKKYPNDYTQISKRYNTYSHRDDVSMGYDLSIEHHCCELGLSWANLKGQVLYCLNKK